MSDPTRHHRADLSELGGKPKAAAKSIGDSGDKAKKLALAVGLFAVAGAIFAWNTFGGRSRDKGEVVSNVMGGSGGDAAAGAAGATTATTSGDGDVDLPRREPFEVPVGGRPFASQPDPNAPVPEDDPEPSTPPEG